MRRPYLIILPSSNAGQGFRANERSSGAGLGRCYIRRFIWQITQHTMPNGIQASAHGAEIRV